MKQNDGVIFNIQPFSVQDGPGIRTTVFLKGCNLRCYWCHNPESWRREPEVQFFASKCIGCGRCGEVCPVGGGAAAALQSLRAGQGVSEGGCTACGACARECYSGALQVTGRTISVSELMELLTRDRDVFTQSGGGVTFSGGEPLLQPRFLREALRAAKEEGISTAVETAACVPWETIEPMLPDVDLFLCDLKTMDSERHRQAVGAPNGQILSNIRRLSEAGMEVRLRTPVIPGFNDSPEAIRAIGEFARSLPRPYPVELLPFHGYCVGKYESLGLRYEARSLTTPPDALLCQLRALL